MDFVFSASIEETPQSSAFDVSPLLEFSSTWGGEAWEIVAAVQVNDFSVIATFGCFY
jgi:hypothetical protein